MTRPIGWPATDLRARLDAPRPQKPGPLDWFILALTCVCCVAIVAAVIAAAVVVCSAAFALGGVIAGVVFFGLGPD